MEFCHVLRRYLIRRAQLEGQPNTACAIFRHYSRLDCRLRILAYREHSVVLEEQSRRGAYALYDDFAYRLVTYQREATARDRPAKLVSDSRQYHRDRATVSGEGS